jgi:hypothetical protein
MNTVASPQTQNFFLQHKTHAMIHHDPQGSLDFLSFAVMPEMDL